MVTYLSFMLFALVMAFAATRKGAMLDSVSEVAYILPKWAFTAWMALVGMLLMPGLMESLPESRQWLGFLAVVGALCVAASPYYKTESRVLHYGGGAFCSLRGRRVLRHPLNGDCGHAPTLAAAGMGSRPLPTKGADVRQC